MEKEKKYIVRFEDGHDSEPLDRYAIISMAKEGQITPDCQLRSVLLPTWEKAYKVDFLQSLLIEQVQEKIKSQREQSQWNMIRDKISLRGDDDPFAVIAQEGISMGPAGPFMRLFAAVLDGLIVGIGGLILMALFAIFYRKGILGAGTVAYFWIISTWIWIMLYYILGWSIRSQTLGERFFGLVLVKKDRTGLYPGRAACYFLLMIPLGVFSFISWALTGGRGTFQEALTGTWIRRFVKSRGII